MTGSILSWETAHGPLPSAAEQPEKDNPLRTAEMTLEDDYGMIDGVINNGRRGEELEKAQGVRRADNAGEKPSIRERLEDGETGVCRSISHRRARSPVVDVPGAWLHYEPEQEMAAGMGVLPG